MKEVYLVQPASTGRVKFLHLMLDADTVSRVWGLVNGRTQSTSNVYKTINVGKANEKSPEQAALEDFERLLKKKTEEGYREVSAKDFETIESGRVHDAVAYDVLNFSEPPKSFTVSKPVSKIEDKKLDKLISSGRALVQCKENGLCHWVFMDAKRNVRIFTRRMDDHTAKYPEIVQAFRETDNVEGPALFATEFVVHATGKGHTHDFKLMCGISRADTVKGELKFTGGKLVETEKRKQALKANFKSRVRACVFNVLYNDGHDYTQGAYAQAWEYLNKTFWDEANLYALYVPTVVHATDALGLRKLAQDTRKKCEGFVVWDLQDSVEISFTGKPKRRACYKVKPTQETDVVVYAVESGKGKRQGQVAALLIGGYDEDTGEFLKFGKCGSGLSDETSDPAYWQDLPCVVEIEYAEQFETGKFQFPVFKGKHPDKTPEECVFSL